MTFQRHSSNQEVYSGESSCGKSDGEERFEALFEGHHGLRLQVTILLDLSEDQVGSEALYGVVELVLPELAGLSAHPIVWPVRVLLAMQILEVLNPVSMESTSTSGSPDMQLQNLKPSRQK